VRFKLCCGSSFAAAQSLRTPRPLPSPCFRAGFARRRCRDCQLIRDLTEHRSPTALPRGEPRFFATSSRHTTALLDHSLPARHRCSPSSQAGVLAFQPGMLRHTCIINRSTTTVVVAPTRGLLITARSHRLVLGAQTHSGRMNGLTDKGPSNRSAQCGDMSESSTPSRNGLLAQL
jgi:hypothetical protein